MLNDDLMKLKELTRTLTSNGYLTDQAAAWEYAFNSVSDLVCITNTSFQIKFLNTKFLEKLPEGHDAYINRTINDLFVTDVVKDVLPSEVVEEVHYEERFFAELGGWFIKHRYIIRNLSKDIIGYTFMFTDVTARKRAELMWHTSDARFKDLFNHMPVGAVVFFPLEKGTDFKVIDLNPAAEQFSDAPVLEIIGKKMSELSNSDTCFELQKQMQDVFDTGRYTRIPTTSYNNCLVKGWKELFLMKLPSGEVVILYTDESAKIKTQRELKQSEELLSGVFNVIPDIIGIQDANQNAIRYNKPGRDLLNVTPEELIHKKCYELLGRNAPCEDCHTQRSKDTKKPEKQLKYIDELSGWYDCRSYPILDELGEVKYIVEHLRDVTDLIVAQEKKEAYYKKMLKIFQRLNFIVSAVEGYIWEKKFVEGESELVYSYIDQTFCRDFYMLDVSMVDDCQYTCTGALDKTSTELIETFTSSGRVHTFIDVGAITDAHCLEQGLPCDYFEMGYIERAPGKLEWVILHVRKKPLFDDEGNVIGLLGFANDCLTDMYSIRELILEGLADGTIVPLKTSEKSRIYWLVKRKKENTDLTHLNFP